MATLQEKALADWQGRIQAAEYGVEKELREAQAEIDRINRALDRLPVERANGALATFVSTFNYTLVRDRYDRTTAGGQECQWAARKALEAIGRLDESQARQLRFTKRILNELARCAGRVEPI